MSQIFRRFSRRSGNFNFQQRVFQYGLVRNYSQQYQRMNNNNYTRPVYITLGFFGLFGSSNTSPDKEKVKSDDSKTKNKINYEAIRNEIRKILDDYEWDDGSWGPVLVRLAWHASGTYSKNDSTGGSDGATMRFSPESDDGANKGLHEARKRIQRVKDKHPEITHSDLWVLASYVAIEEMGGPKIEFRPGRKDKEDGKSCPQMGRLPDAAQGAQHIRDVFYRMGFNDQEIVALMGAHGVGRCHTDRSGYEGPWTRSPTTVANEYFKALYDEKWVKRNWKGPVQFENEKDRTLMMLPADLAMKTDPEFRKWSDKYYKDNDLWLKDFAAPFKKLTELGVKTN